MEEKGYYTPYKGRMFLYEGHLWILDKILPKVFNEMLDGNFQTMRKVDTLGFVAVSSRPYWAPFEEYKRFPSIGKYARVGPGSVWYELFKRIDQREVGTQFQIQFEGQRQWKTLYQSERDRHNMLAVNEMMAEFQNEQDMFDRESFESTMKLQWKIDSSNNNAIEKGFYTPYGSCMFLYEQQIWISEKKLAKIILYVLDKRSDMMPRLDKSISAEINLPYHAPFEQNKRFPSIGKYVRVGPGSVWYDIFKQIMDKNFFGLGNVINFNDIMTKFENEEDMLDRESFENQMKIQWKNDSNNLGKVDDVD